MKTNLSDILAFCLEWFATIVATCIIVLVVYVFIPISNPFRRKRKWFINENSSSPSMDGIHHKTQTIPTGMKCSKCGSKERLTDHHVYPVCHFAHKRDGLKIKLCVYCHRRIEDYILAIESHLGNVRYGERYKLDKSDYERTIHNFLHNRTIVYVGVWSWLLAYDCMVHNMVFDPHLTLWFGSEGYCLKYRTVHTPHAYPII